MDIMINHEVIDTVCNSLRASKQSLGAQLAKATEENKKEILESQLAEVEEALNIFTKMQ